MAEVSTSVQHITALDFDISRAETGETMLLEDIRDIIEYMRTMSPDDMEIINNKVIESVEGLDVKFGIKDVVCPSCGDKTEIVEINLENELFTKASQSNPKKYV